MGTRSFDLAVLGAGPAGLTAALVAAQSADVALIAPRLPGEHDAPRVDAVPARLLALLVELGVHPHALGADGLHCDRLVAWSSETPQSRRLSAAAHVERPAFDQALLSCVRRQGRIAVFESAACRVDDGLYQGDGWQARRLVDASGRAATTADGVVRPPQPWASRTLWHAVSRSHGRLPFALLALPDGYAYRIAGQRLDVVGFVGRRAAVLGRPADLEGHVRESGGGWLLDGLPSLASFAEGRAGTASVQWSTSSSRQADRPVRIGEAALARDPLSSQGIAAACSEALFAVAIRGEADQAAFESRQVEQRLAHLTALGRMLESVRFASRPPWRDYAAFVAAEADRVEVRSTAALREGRVVPLA